jgi:ribose 5-phosphate isomerase B
MSEISDQEISLMVRRVLARTMGLPLPEAATFASPGGPKGTSDASTERKVVAIGSDHGGYELKERIKSDLPSQGFEAVDLGTNGKDPVDYPDFAHAVATMVISGKAWRGIVVDGAGIGSCIVANKVPGVRAGLAYDYSSAVNSREHNDTNVLTLGAGLTGPSLALQIVRTWLATPFGGGRHEGRIEKIRAVERQYLK